jgi:hypothetical protein
MRIQQIKAILGPEIAKHVRKSDDLDRTYFILDNFFINELGQDVCCNVCDIWYNKTRDQFCIYIMFHKHREIQEKYKFRSDTWHCPLGDPELVSKVRTIVKEILDIKIQSIEHYHKLRGY